MVEMFLAPAASVVPAVTLIGVATAMIVLAAIDLWREQLHDLVTVLVLLAALAGLSLEGIAPAQWVGAVGSAVVVFLTYLALGLRGAMYGGDVKLSPLPALVLGAVSPVLAFLWLTSTFAVQTLFHGVAARLQAQPAVGPSVPTEMPHVPAMALCFAALLPLVVAL